VTNKMVTCLRYTASLRINKELSFKTSLDIPSVRKPKVFEIFLFSRILYVFVTGTFFRHFKTENNENMLKDS